VPFTKGKPPKQQKTDKYSCDKLFKGGNVMKHSIAILMASMLFISTAALAYENNPNFNIPEIYPELQFKPHGHSMKPYQTDAGMELFGQDMYGSVVADVMLGRDRPGTDDGWTTEMLEDWSPVTGFGYKI